MIRILTVPIRKKNLHAAIMPLISQSHLTWKRYWQAQLVGTGMTLKQNFVLRQLARREFLRPADIAELLFCDRPTASVIVRNLEKHGWVARCKDANNGKQVCVTITPKGRRSLRRVEKRLAEGGPHPDPLACFGPAEVERFGELLRRLILHLGPACGAARAEPDNDRSERDCRQ